GILEAALPARRDRPRALAAWDGGSRTEVGPDGLFLSGDRGTGRTQRGSCDFLWNEWALHGSSDRTRSSSLTGGAAGPRGQRLGIAIQDRGQCPDRQKRERDNELNQDFESHSSSPPGEPFGAQIPLCRLVPFTEAPAWARAEMHCPFQRSCS